MIRQHTKTTLLARLARFNEENRRLPNTHITKLQLIRTGLLIKQCSVCGITNWQNKKISLHLDHVDGDATNNTLSNLRLLCPNCHSQTKTYCGKNNKNKARKYPKSYCKLCNKQLSTTWATRCLECYNNTKTRSTKIKWPDKIKLSKMVKERTSMESLAKQLGVSSNALRKHCRKHNIDWH